MSVFRFSIATLCLSAMAPFLSAEPDAPLLEFKPPEWKTVKKEVSMIGWREFNPPSGRPTNYYLEGVFTGQLTVVDSIGINENGVWVAGGQRLQFRPPNNRIIAEVDDSPEGWSSTHFANEYWDWDNSISGSSEAEVLDAIVNSTGELVDVHYEPDYDLFEIWSTDHVSAGSNTGGWFYYEDKIAYHDINFIFSKPDTDKDAEARAAEIELAPNPYINPLPSEEANYIGASFREKRTERTYVRYASEFKLKLKLCPGEYVLKWRVVGKHKDDTGSPQEFPQQREIAIDENTSLDADGYYDLEWIDIAQELIPDYVYRLSTYEEGATQTFYIEPKDDCGCSELGGSGGVAFGSDSARAWFNLGDSASGESAGFIDLPTENIEENSHLPEALKVVKGSSKTARFVYDDDGALRQAQSDKRIIDIVPLPDPNEGYQLKYYDAADANGWEEGRFRTFDPSATPTSVWTVKRLADSGGFKRLEITRSEGGTDFVHVFSQDLTTPTTKGFSEANGLKTTTRSESAAPDGDIYRTTTLSDTVYGVSSVKRERIHAFAWGEEIVEETLDPSGSNPLTTTYQYHTSGVGQGQIWRITTPDGTVTQNTYEAVAIGPDVTSSRIVGTTTTYLNGRVQTTTHGTLEDLTSNSVDEDHSLVTNTETFGGQLIRRSWTIGYATAEDLDSDGVLYTTSRSIRAASSTATWDDSRNEVTITRVATPASGRISVTVSPDGTATRTHRGLPDTEGVLVVTTETGPVNTTGTGLLSGSGGTRTEEEIDVLGRTLSRTTIDIASNLTTAFEQVTDWDAINNLLPTHISHLDGGEEVRSYSPCCGKVQSITRRGFTTHYTYDDLGRQETVTADGITTKTKYDASDRARETTVYPEGTPGSAKLVSGSTYDPAGRLTATTAPYAHGQTVTTTIVETINATTGETTTVTTYPSDTGLAAGEVTELRAPDGFTLRVTGNAAAPVSYAYTTGSLPDASLWGYDSADRFFITTETKLDAAGTATGETIDTYQDSLGRAIKTVYADGAAKRTFHDDAGRVAKEVDPDGVTVLYAHATGSFGEKTTMAIDLAATTGGSRNGDIDLSGGYDRVTETVSTVVDRSGVTVHRTTTSVWEQSGAATEVSVSDRSVDGLKSWQTFRGTQTTATVVVWGSGGARTETTVAPDETQTVRTYSGARLADEVRKDADDVTLASIAYLYDDYGRVEEVTQAGVGTTSYTWFDDGQTETVTTPNPGTGAQTTTYAYNKRGWLKSVTHPDTAVTETSYYPTGQVKRTWGARTYPVEYTYDPQGRMKTMTTWQDFTGETGEATTTWNYDPQRGWLESKRYNDNKGPSYTYTDAGRLETRTWARSPSLVTTYGYTDAGEVERIDYSDTTPDVAHTYDRAGRLHTTTDAAGLLTRDYHPASGQIEEELYSGSGIMSGQSLTRVYDARYRVGSVTTDGAYSVGYGYDRAGRLETVSQGAHQAVYGYKPNQGVIESVTVKRAGVERVTHTRQTDALGRTTQVKSASGATVHVQRDYGHNDANQRTGVELEDGRHWAYGYDDLGQVTSAQKRLADNTTPLPGYTFGYTFDDIGNRTQTVTNDDTATYTPDSTLLNRYESRTVPDVVDVRGEAHADAAVTVNTLSTTRSGKDFYREVTFTNGSAAVSDTVSIEAVRVGPPLESASEERAVFLPQTPEVFVYDDDGNLEQDGRWDYTWDAENRLVSMETRASIAIAFPELKQRLEFAYDAQGRRIRKVVKDWDAVGSAWQTSQDLRFIYDGWNLLTELDALDGNAVVRSHAWGLDLSQTMQGAGGVGGLLWSGTPTHSFAACSDANGNIVAWVNTATLAVSGRADYGAFGEVVQRTGIAGVLPFGFSSKYRDTESGLLYYGYRYYNPSAGRWLSRDPIEEAGGLNLYHFNFNQAISRIDPDGAASELMDQLRSGFPENGTIDDFTGGVDSLISNTVGRGGTVGKWALYGLITREAGFTESIQNDLLKNYLNLGGHTNPFTISKSDMLKLQIQFSLLESTTFVADLKKAYSGMSPGGTYSLAGQYDVPARAMLTGTLGNFFAVTDIKIDCVRNADGNGGAWIAKGTFKAKDTYDFNYTRGEAGRALQAFLQNNMTAGPFDGRTVNGQLKTVIMSRVGAAGHGTDFGVTSEDVPFYQKSGEQWATIGKSAPAP